MMRAYTVVSGLNRKAVEIIRELTFILGAAPQIALPTSNITAVAKNSHFTSKMPYAFPLKDVSLSTATRRGKAYLTLTR